MIEAACIDKLGDIVLDLYCQEIAEIERIAIIIGCLDKIAKIADGKGFAVAAAGMIELIVEIESGNSGRHIDCKGEDGIAIGGGGEFVIRELTL